MTDSTDMVLTRYYEEAQSWAEDRQRKLRRSRTIAWTVAGVALGVATFEAIALASLAPLKTVVPYTLMVDRQTGNVEALEPLGEKDVSPDDALARSFLAQYVIARESFEIGSLRSDYRKAALWSAGDVRSRYVASVQASNPQSFLATMPRKARINTDVVSISSLSSDTALVRFTTTRQDPGEQPQPAQYWAAVMTYRFSTASMSENDRLLNPLGFQVTRYRRNAETVESGAQDTRSPGAGLASKQETQVP